MDGYECFIFAWNGAPTGGANDLAICCDTKEEAIAEAERFKAKYNSVQIMDKYGDIVE